MFFAVTILCDLAFSLALSLSRSRFPLPLIRRCPLNFLALPRSVAVIRVTGPTLISNGVQTQFILSPSVWSPFWPAITLSAVVLPAGAVTFSPTAFTMSSGSSNTVWITSTRSDDVTISITWTLSSAGYVVPPENLILTSVGGATNKNTQTYTTRGAS